MNNNTFGNKILWKQSLKKAFLASLLFLFLNLFQGQNIVREIVEDAGFDIINKLLFSTQDQGINDSKANIITVFAFDNAYMKTHGLFNEKIDIGNYGYTFPREEIAKFINNLDKRIEEIKSYGDEFCPKVLFIDIDMRFPTGANNTLSKGDEALLEALAKPHCYTILLPKNSLYNFVADKGSDTIQTLIQQQRINFATPFFHVGSDAVIRRYEPVTSIADTVYPSASVALWQILRYGKINTKQAQQLFTDDVKIKIEKSKPKKSSSEEEKASHKQPNTRINSAITNVNANRIWIRNYKKEDTCLQRSHWLNLEKYSVNCDISKVFPNNFKQTIIMLGATEKEAEELGAGASDYHSILKFISSETMSGVDIHANTLMTLLHLDKPNHNIHEQNQAKSQAPIMRQVPLIVGIITVFISFLLIDMLITLLLQHWGVSNTGVIFLSSLIVNTLVLFLISLSFLHANRPLWFNWYSLLLLYELSEGTGIIIKFMPWLINIPLIKSISAAKKWVTTYILQLWRKINEKINN